jgi:SAM-dependent methyltransferase
MHHDVAADEPPGSFDLIHARLVLTHVSRRDAAVAAVAAMARALRPGGWLVLEDADPALQPLLCPEESGPAEVVGNRLRRGFRSLLAAQGADLEFGRTLQRRLREAGLGGVAADAYFPMTGPACAMLERATVLQVRDLLVAAGLGHRARDRRAPGEHRDGADGAGHGAADHGVGTAGRRRSRHRSQHRARRTVNARRTEAVTDAGARPRTAE